MRRLAPPTLAAALAAVGVAAGALAAATPAAAAPPRLVIENGVTQPVFSYADAIRETVYVETPLDSDRDGRRDRVAAFVTRPRETAQGLKVASIIEASPYFGGLLDVPYHPVDITDEPARRRVARRNLAVGPMPEAVVASDWSYYDNYFVPRGYAVLAVDSIGTGGSDGCPTAGGANEGLAMKAVVDWLNGRAPAYTADGRPARADWSTGSVGMAGKSYDGTLPNQTAATGVPGLKTIVAISAISSWYDYYRANGGVVAPGGFQGEDTDVMAKAVLTRADPEACAAVMAELERAQDRVTGDYSPYWAERDFLRGVDQVRASVFVVHGLHDWNVKTKQFAQWYEALARRGVPRKLWLHQAAHHDPRQVRIEYWFRTLNRWFDHWLYGVDNGITAEPRVDLEEAPGVWKTYADWPDPAARPVTLRFGTGAGAGQPGTLGPVPAGAGAGQGFVDTPARTAEQLAAGWTAADPNRLLYLTPPLRRPVRLSGTPRVTVRASVDGRSPYLTALLVDYGEDTRWTGLEATEETACLGESIPGNSGCWRVYRNQTATTPFEIVTRGWLDVRNRRSAGVTEPVEPGRTYTFRWTLEPQDHVFKPGHRIGVVLISTDRDYTLRYPAGTKVSVRLGPSGIELPLANRSPAPPEAGSDPPGTRRSSHSGDLIRPA